MNKRFVEEIDRFSTFCFSYSNLFTVFVSVFRNEGVVALYRGALSSIVGVLPYSGCVFYTYESLKHFRLGKRNESCSSQRLSSSSDYDHRRTITKTERLIFGAISGLIGQTVSYPFDVVRRRLQTATVIRPQEASLGAIATAKKIIREEGVMGGLYKGVTMNWFKGPISVGVSFMTFDTLIKLIRQSSYFAQNS